MPNFSAFKKYFWEYDLQYSWVEKYLGFFIERILCRCDFTDLKILLKSAPMDIVMNVLNSSINIPVGRKNLIKSIL